MLSPSQQTGLAALATAAVPAEQQTGCPAELTTAQGVLESNYGLLTTGKFNVFGIKAYAGALSSTLCATHEWFTDAEAAAFLKRREGRTAQLAEPEQARGERRLWRVADRFADFASLADCMAYHGRMLQHGPYLAAWTQFQKDHSLDSYIRGIAVHYATDPTYGETLSGMAHSPRIAAAVVAVRNRLQSV